MRKFYSIHLILAIIAQIDLELHQLGVKTAFLNRELYEKNLYGTSYRFHGQRSKGQSLKVKQINIWPEIVIQIVVFEFS